MKFYLVVCFLSSIMLFFNAGKPLKMPEGQTLKLPLVLEKYKDKIKDQFTKPESANILISSLTGNKKGISPYTKKAFKKMNLSFLLSPSGIHLSSIFLFLSFFIGIIKKRKLKKVIQMIFLSSFLFLPNFLSIKRLVVLRLLFQLKSLKKFNLSTETIFFLTFIISIFMGHYHKSPFGFIYSFFFLGTFFGLKDYSKFKMILALFHTQLIINLFMGEDISFFAIPLGLLYSFLFTFLFILILIFILSFWAIPINWIEPFLNTYLWAIKASARQLRGTNMNSSIFIILAVSLLLFWRPRRRNLIIFGALLFLHCNCATAPSVFSH